MLLWNFITLLTFVCAVPNCTLGSHTNDCTSRYFDCQDYQTAGHNTSTVYQVTPLGLYSSVDVFCDFEDDQGWLVIQRRIDDSVNFDRNWKDYEVGFGDIRGNYWIGLLPLWRLLMQGHYQLLIIIKDWDETTKYAKYEYFKIGSPEEKYTLQALVYSGTAGDCLYSLRGQKFSTKDKDNDSSSRHCAQRRGAGWWYNDCSPSSLNGQHFPEGQRDNPGEGGIRWNFWKYDYSFKFSEMKIRRA